MIFPASKHTLFPVKKNWSVLLREGLWAGCRGEHRVHYSWRSRPPVPRNPIRRVNRIQARVWTGAVWIPPRQHRHLLLLHFLLIFTTVKAPFLFFLPSCCLRCLNLLVWKRRALQNPIEFLPSCVRWKNVGIFFLVKWETPLYITEICSFNFSVGKVSVFAFRCFYFFLLIGSKAWCCWCSLAVDAIVLGK